MRALSKLHLGEQREAHPSNLVRGLGAGSYGIDNPLAAAETCRLLADTAKGATLISVVHNPSLLPMLAERVLGLRQGRIAFDVPLSALDDRQLARLYRPDASSVLAVPHARVEAHRDEVGR